VNRRRSAVLNDSSVELVADGLSTPMDVRIHHSLKQPRGNNCSMIFISNGIFNITVMEILMHA